VPPLFPEQEGDPPQASEFVHVGGIMTSRVRISVILKDQAQPRDLPEILRCADPDAKLARCWGEMRIISLVIPDSPDLKKVEAAVKRLSRHKLVESASTFSEFPGRAPKISGEYRPSGPHRSIVGGAGAVPVSPR